MINLKLLIHNPNFDDTNLYTLQHNDDGVFNTYTLKNDIHPMKYNNIEVVCTGNDYIVKLGTRKEIKIGYDEIEYILAVFNYINKVTKQDFTVRCFKEME